jgi:energy-coupling factor transport system ATP-binding protein
MNPVEVRGFTYSYPRASEPALNDIHLAVEPGERVLLAGPSGGGKSTLLRALCGLVPRYHGGKVKGRVFLDGMDTRQHGPAELFGKVSIVFQDPESQLVMSRARSDMAFGLENVGWEPGAIEERGSDLGELLCIAHLLDRFVPDLSGGEKQMLAIAAAVAVRPRVLLMDEPTSQLDPRAAGKVLRMLETIHREEGVALVFSEHRLDRCMSMADRVVVLQGGEVAYDGGPRGLAGGLSVPGGNGKRAARGGGRGRSGGTRREAAQPEGFGREFLPPVSILHGLQRAGNGNGGNGCNGEGRRVPLTIREAVRWNGSALARLSRSGEARVKENTARTRKKRGRRKTLLRCNEVSFRYDGGLTALRGVSLDVREGEVLSLLGPNGAGKTTLVKHFNGLLKPSSGKVELRGQDISSLSTAGLSRRVGYLAQDVGGYLTRDTLRDELAFTLRLQEVPREKWDDRIGDTLDVVGLAHMADRNPRSLSCGERHLAALASVMVGRPGVMVLDEPTRGVDPGFKGRLARLLRSLAKRGTAVVVVTQDVEFAARTSHRCAVMEKGRMDKVGPARTILGAPGPYSTQVATLFAKVARPGNGGGEPLTPADAWRMLQSLEQTGRENAQPGGATS